MKFTVETDRPLIRAAGSSRRYALARIVAPKAPPRTNRIPVNVALVLDRSGSMEGDRKLELARHAVEHALRMLQPEDRFALVVYDDRIDVLARSTPATPTAIRDALDNLSRVDSRGSTDLGGGWLAGCEEIAKFLDRERVNRCLLLTDGLANHGITERHELARLAGDLRRRGVVTSTFGVGADFDERLLRDMAHEGGGNSWFIEGASQIPELITAELGEALEVTARAAVLRVRTESGCSARPLNRFRHETSRDRSETMIELGDLVSAQELDVVVQLEFASGTVGEKVLAEFCLGTATEGIEVSPVELAWTFASHRDNDAQPRSVVVDRAVAIQYVARARAEATEYNRNGDYERARRVLERTSRRISAYAGQDAELRELERALRTDVRVYAEEVMSPMSLKMSFYVSEASAKGRGRSGRARR